MFEQTGGVKAVGPVAVGGYLPRGRGVGHQRANGGVHAGQAGAVAAVPTREGVVAAGIEDEDVESVVGPLHLAADGRGEDAAVFEFVGALQVGVDEFPDHPYMLGTRRTTKRLHLRFGETRQWYPMASVSNRAFEELELVSWQQVLEVTDDKKISIHQVRAKAKERLVKQKVRV